MTQEIYDYLWIRNVLIALKAKDISTNVYSLEEAAYVVRCIVNLLEKENFVLAFDNSQDMILDLTQEFRFKYNDKELNSNINLIINKINQYKNINSNKKDLMIDLFYTNESKKRNLSYFYKNSKEVINCLIQNDIHTYRNLFCNENTNEPIALEIIDVLDYVSLVNLIMNDYPNYFKDEKIKEKTNNNFEQLLLVKNIPFDIRNSIKKTLKLINQNSNQIKRLKK